MRKDRTYMFWDFVEGFEDSVKLKSAELYRKWIKANKPETINFEMIAYNTLITKPNKEEIKLYGNA